MSKKIGFWSVFAIVTGSQVGSTILIAPSSLSGFGLYSLIGWILSAFGAIAICLVFASLCARYPDTGGPHAYIKHVFGPTYAFFTGWVYWVISWVSTTVVVVSAIGALSPFFGSVSLQHEVMSQILLLILIMFLNLRGVQAAGKTEFFLIIMKFIPLVSIPLFAFSYFDINNFVISTDLINVSTTSIISKVILLTFFGFIGLECATTAAGEVENPKKTIPRAIVLGTASVAVLYIINCMGIMGLVPGAELAASKAPYVMATKILFGGKWYLFVSILSFLVCLGTLNAWVLASGQIVLGLAQDGLMPSIFSKKNDFGAPFLGIVSSCLGIVPLLIMTSNKSLASQVNQIIDLSVISFIFIYLFCTLAFIKLKITKEKFSWFTSFYCLISVSFCLWIIFNSDINSVLISLMFAASSLPMYFFWYKKSVK